MLFQSYVPLWSIFCTAKTTEMLRSACQLTCFGKPHKLVYIKHRNAGTFYVKVATLKEI